MEQKGESSVWKQADEGWKDREHKEFSFLSSNLESSGSLCSSCQASGYMLYFISSSKQPDDVSTAIVAIIFLQQEETMT